MNASSDAELNRWIVLSLSITFLIAAVVVGVTYSTNNIWCGSFMRSGVLLGALWLGMPTKGRAAAWAKISPLWIFGIAFGLLFILRRPQVFLPLLSALFTLQFLLPLLMGKRKPPRPGSY